VLGGAFEKMIEDFKALEFKNGKLVLLDQRKLPTKVEYIEYDSSEEIGYAIKEMVVRGAPAIGGVAAYGVYFALKEAKGNWQEFEKKCDFLISMRPTAVNLPWAVNRLKKRAEETKMDAEAVKAEAAKLVSEDIEMNRTMGKIGSEIIRPGATILTHCNTGALATCGWGSALGVIKTAHEEGKKIFVYADETRPRLQGARLTAWELVRAGIPSALLPDSAAATLIRDGKIDCVILGADRITANGDVANKVGTFALSVICKHYGVPFYSVAPTSTIDLSTPSGDKIVIEERDKDEVRKIEGVQIAPPGIDVYNPCFDVTPHQNITGIITEKGILREPYEISIRKAMGK